jgi:hypothetical protein
MSSVPSGRAAKFSDLVRGASLRGAPSSFTPAASLRLGRAVGTLLRRRSEAAGSVIVARGGDGPQLAVRDGLVQGLVLSGFDVVDLGHAESDLFTFALRTQGALGGALVGVAGESLGVMLFTQARPLVGEGLVELARLAEEGAFCSGSGSLVLRDLRVAFRQSPPISERDTEVDS